MVTEMRDDEGAPMGGATAPAHTGSTPPSIGRSGGEDDPAGALAWAMVRDAAVRALVHVLANRAGTVSAVAGMLAPEAPARGAIVEALQGEGEKLLLLVEHFRLLQLEPPGPAEPVHVPDAVAEAVRLLAEHPRVAGVRCTVTVAPDAPPALARHDRVRLAVWALLVAAVDAGADPVAVRVARDADGCALVRVPAPATPAAPGTDTPQEPRAAAWLAMPHGRVTRDAEGWTLVLPSLLGRA